VGKLKSFTNSLKNKTAETKKGGGKLKSFTNSLKNKTAQTKKGGGKPRPYKINITGLYFNNCIK
jgi:hypothetical protein